MNLDKFQVEDFLIDFRKGKEMPWRDKKIRSIAIADSFSRIGIKQRSYRVRYCGSSLAFSHSLETGEKRLVGANFCRDRLCPMCQWRRSLKVFHQVSKVMDYLLPGSNLVPVFLTLTVKNCTPVDFSSTLDNIFKAWFLLVRRRSVARQIKGWFRALEVTYNRKSGTLHPHLHCILLVDKSYFKKDNAEYLHTSDWVQLWRQALKVDYDPICFIEKITMKNKRKHQAVAEVAKYTFKDSDFIIPGDDELTDKLIVTLANGLAGRRLYAFGGLMKSAAKAVLADEIGEGDLVHIDDELRRDVADCIVVYRWHAGLANYVKYNE